MPGPNRRHWLTKAFACEAVAWALGGLDLGGFVLRRDAAHRQLSSLFGLTVLDASGRPRR